jgi:hypothetical protein
MSGRCGACRHFAAAPGAIERGLPGLSILASAHAASRADDGSCARHDRYVTARAGCADFSSREQATARAD